MSAKYPRTPHLPWSPGGTNDDKRLDLVESFVGTNIVITEKCDGSNLTYTRESVFARTHSSAPKHPSFALAKATHASIKTLIPEGHSVFCEYCYAVHSIEYSALPSYSLVFGVRRDGDAVWLSWDDVEAVAESIGLPTVPVLFRGTVKTERELVELTTRLSSGTSVFGGSCEGVVVRRAGTFLDEAFSYSVAKWVRAGHVQTDEHWLHQTIRPQRLSP
ncbi:MAG: RNA ligase family protein [Polyangiaceae bacterium]